MEKSSKKTKRVKPAKKQAARVPVPWDRIRKMWEAGESYEKIAKATDPHYNPNKPDPTQSTRAKVSRAMTVGIVIDGKSIRLKPRSRKEFNKKKAAVKLKATANPKPKTTKAKSNKAKATKKKPAQPNQATEVPALEQTSEAGAEALAIPEAN